MYTWVCVKHRRLSFRKVYLKFKLAQKFKTKRFLNFGNAFCNFAFISIWKNVLPFNIKLVKFSSPKDVWLKLAMIYWFRRRKFSKFVNVFSLFCNNNPLVGKWRGLHLNNLNPLQPKLAHWFWRRTIYEKFTTATTTTMTDKGQIVIRPLAQVSIKTPTKKDAYGLWHDKITHFQKHIQSASNLGPNQNFSECIKFRNNLTYFQKGFQSALTVYINISNDVAFKLT